MAQQPAPQTHQASSGSSVLSSPSSAPSPIPFACIDWNSVPRVAHPGTEGTAYWQTMQFGGLRVRLVEYSAGYLADHWCQKGHVVHVIEGTLITEQQSVDGAASGGAAAAVSHLPMFSPEAPAAQSLTMRAGQTYVVSDGLSSHRSRTDGAVKLLIIDGEFLAAAHKQ